jgi:hypothetical protein
VERRECDRLVIMAYGFLESGEHDTCTIYSDAIIAAIPSISTELLEKKVVEHWEQLHSLDGVLK